MVPRRVILHCSATPDHKPEDNLFDLFGLSEIRDWHLDRGFDDVGYHHIIRRTGVIEKGRSENVQGAHCRGHNEDTLGVCMVGTDDFSSFQIDSLCKLFWDIYKRHGIKPSGWYGHRLYSSKSCPGVAISFVRKLFQFVLIFELAPLTRKKA